jgi:hypothetical protein
LIGIRASSSFFAAAKVRDAKILIETVDALVERFQEHITGRAFTIGGDRQIGYHMARIWPLDAAL